MTSYRLTKAGMRREHASYLARIAVHAILLIGGFVAANVFYRPELRTFGNVLACLMVLVGYIPWRNYILFLKYYDADAFIEVEGDILWLNNRHLGRISFPLDQLTSFVHRKRRTEVLELRTSKGDELNLRDYENMPQLVDDLRRTQAGLKYEVVT